jgi:glycine/D-amino acid oxidase-like deaminating enzyme
MGVEFGAAVIGGGFFGCELAARLGRLAPPVVLVERAADLMTRASYHNQARVHNGYHYPRSLLTALRSRQNYPRFLAEYAPCIDRSFRTYYAVARQFSKVTASQFRHFCGRIQAPCEPAPADVRRLFNPQLVEEVFAVEECAFDAVKLRGLVRAKLRGAGVDVRLGTAVARLAAGPPGAVTVTCQSAGGAETTLTAREVFVCTYSQTNALLRDSGLPAEALKHELTELALVEVPGSLRGAGVTVMCGPFFSCMPFPDRGLHSLSHVRYTPHGEWHDGPGGTSAPVGRRSHFPPMARDAARYLPLLAEARHVDSLWEVKTVLPRNEADDGRPILFRQGCGLPNVHCVLGGKIDNVYDMLDRVTELFPGRRVA